MLTKEDHRYITELTDRGFVVLPTRCKFPKGIPGWQKVESTWEDMADWNRATGYCIKTGHWSGVTVIDVDKPDREWFDKFWAQSGLEPTTTVETPSGGLHLYYKYDKRLKQTQGFSGVAIDIRNDRGVIVAPNSPYDTDKECKKQFIGKRYKLVIGFDKMRELD